MLDDAWSRWIAEANETLAAYGDCEARWWSFGPPCNHFRLVIGEPTGKNVAIMLFHTKYLAGPTDWPHQRLKVSRDLNSSETWSDWRFHLEDAAAGFRAESATFCWSQDIDVMDEHKWLVWRPPPAV